MSIFILLGTLTYTVWKFLPTILYCFYPSTISISFISPGDEKPITLDTETRQLISTLTNLGFISLGIKIEKFPLWGKKNYEINFYSQEEYCFASILTQKKRVSYYLYTPFKNGGLVLTNNGKSSIDSKSDYLISNISGAEPEDILNIHRVQVQNLSESQDPINTFTQETRIESTKMFYAASQSRHLMRKKGILNSLLAAYYILFTVGCFLYFSNK